MGTGKTHRLKTCATRRDSPEPDTRASIKCEPYKRHRDQWIEWVNRPQTEGELARLRMCAVRGQLFGDDCWVKEVAARLNLMATLRPRGRARLDRTALRIG